jgi:hypothetical protein
VPLLYDNESAIKLTNNLVQHARTKHIDWYIRPRWGWPRPNKLRLPGSNSSYSHPLGERPNVPKRLVW